MPESGTPGNGATVCISIKGNVVCATSRSIDECVNLRNLFEDKSGSDAEDDLVGKSELFMSISVL